MIPLLGKRTLEETNSAYPHMYFYYIALTYMLYITVIYMYVRFWNQGCSEVGKLRPTGQKKPFFFPLAHKLGMVFTF